MNIPTKLLYIYIFHQHEILAHKTNLIPPIIKVPVPSQGRECYVFVRDIHLASASMLIQWNF